jgi:hypothetical protein
MDKYGLCEGVFDYDFFCAHKKKTRAPKMDGRGKKKLIFKHFR